MLKEIHDFRSQTSSQQPDQKDLFGKCNLQNSHLVAVTTYEDWFCFCVEADDRM